MRSPSTVATLLRRDRIVISACLVLITLLAWAYLVHLNRQMALAEVRMMAEMGMSMVEMPWTSTDVFFTFAMWTVMMVGMMTGSAAPVLLLFASAHARRGARSVPAGALLFGLGYLAVWAGFSAAATAAQWALQRAAMLSPAMSASSPRVAGAILIAAGVYQLTPVKGACLHYCQTPLGFLMSHWRDGTFGPLKMGARHGVHCLGCCWAVMCVLFVVGVMNLVWVAALSIFVLVEKVGPRGLLIARAAGAAMIAAGIIVFLR